MASMDNLVTNSSSRALLAFSQSSAMSVGGVPLLDLIVAAMGEMVVGIPSRDASAILASSWALTWDEVSTGWGSSFGLWGGGVRTTTGFGLLRVEFPDPWPDMSNIIWHRRFLTSMVMLDSPSDFGGVVLWWLAIMMVENLPIGSAFLSSYPTRYCGMSISR